MSKRIIISLNEKQEVALDKLMADDMEMNRSGYIGRLITQESLRRTEGKEKRSVGRPKKEEVPEVYYPSPDLQYGNRNPYTLENLRGYYSIRKQPLPDPLPEPLSKEELLKWDL